MSKKNTAVTTEQTSKLNGMMSAIGDGMFNGKPLSCDTLVEDIKALSSTETKQDKLEKTASQQKQEIAEMLDYLAANSPDMVPVTLMAQPTSISDATWLSKHTEYTLEQLHNTRPLFGFFVQTCKDHNVKPQEIKKNSAYYDGKGQTDSAIVRGEKLGVIEAGTMDTIQAKRDNKGATDKVRAATRKAEVQQLKSQPKVWVHAQLNALIGTLQGENPANKSVQEANEHAVEILSNACTELLQD